MQAWSSIVHALIPNIAVLTTHLRNFCDICEADEVVLFERATFLVIAEATLRKHADPHRHEKISNIIKQFKLSCRYSRPAGFSLSLSLCVSVGSQSSSPAGRRRSSRVWRCAAGRLPPSSTCSPPVPTSWSSCPTRPSVRVPSSSAWPTLHMRHLRAALPSHTASAATLININAARQHFEKLEGGSYR
jgi:hypothetical protein